MPFLFASMDAFLFPTHGEGWGLPAIEAMAMGLPTVITDWGGTEEMQKNLKTKMMMFLCCNFLGSTEFSGGGENWEGGYSLEVERLDDAFGDSSKGKWAVPSTPHLRQLMRKIVNQPLEACRRGRKGRLQVKSMDLFHLFSTSLIT